MALNNFQDDLKGKIDATSEVDFLAAQSISENHQIFQNDECITVICRESGSDQSNVPEKKDSNESTFRLRDNECKTENVTSSALANDIEKFIEGEEIVDSENPFRKTGKSVRYKLSKSDFITKEEILKQSKYVPVYIKNPDSVLTYPVLNESSPKKRQTQKPLPATRKVPTPAPRTVIEKPKRTSKSKNCQIYPNLSDIKVSQLFQSVATKDSTTFFNNIR